MAATVLRNGIDRLPNGNWFRPLFSKRSVSPPLHTVLEALKAHFYPRCDARLDLISLNTKFPDNLKLSKIVFLNSHHGHIVNCFTVNIFTVRHFTISLQYFEFCREESEENFFKCHAWISSYSVNRVGEKDNVQMFSLSRSAWAF